VAIRRGFAEDVYIVLPSTDPEMMAAQKAALQIVINPLVNWIWFGFGVIAVGTGIALLPERTYAFALSKSASDAATTTAAFLLILLLTGRPLFAQHVESPENAPVMATSELEKDMRREMVCICHTCPHYPLSECSCPEAAKMRAELGEQVKLGKTREQLREWAVERYGSQEPLGAPIDKGFNRLLWALPWTVGGGAAVLVGFVAVRWSRRHGEAQPEELPAPETDLDERLDDELRNLD
jgi:cytochrome c-type biogenesis protein CcmH/NrfF